MGISKLRNLRLLDLEHNQYIDSYLRDTLRKIGKNKIIPIKENINPPMVPAAKGYQKASFVEPIINGLKPRTVEVIVSIIGRIFMLQAFT